MEIIGQTHHLTAKAPPSEAAIKGRQLSLERRMAAKGARAAAKVVLEEGVEVYPDAPPGVGWVLSIKGRQLRYLGTKEKAVQHWADLGRPIGGAMGGPKSGGKTVKG